MPTIKICAVQFQISPDFGKNISRLEQFFKKANKNDCDIICFPELFLTGPLDKSRFSDKIPDISKKHFSRLSREYGIFSVMGSIISRIGGFLYNTSYLFDDNGDILGNYCKNHLVQKSEARHFKPGNSVPVFRTRIGNIGIQICRDLLYPEITRKMMLKEADIVFCPSYWCSKSSSYSRIYNTKYFKNKVPDEVTALASARAIESEVAFVYVNAAGKSDKGVLLGKTQIALPFYGTTDIIKNNNEGVLVKEINLSMVNDARKVYKIEKDIKNYYRK